MSHVTHPLSCADISRNEQFSSEMSQFCCVRKYRYRLRFGTKFLILLTFLSLQRFLLINMVTILMMSAYLASPGLLKIKIFQSKGYNVIIPDFDVTNKILSRDANYIADVVMWPKFGNCSISMREVIITSILKGFDLKNCFFWGVVLV